MFLCRDTVNDLRAKHETLLGFIKVHPTIYSLHTKAVVFSTHRETMFLRRVQNGRSIQTTLDENTKLGIFLADNYL